MYIKSRKDKDLNIYTFLSFYMLLPPFSIIPNLTSPLFPT